MTDPSWTDHGLTAVEHRPLSDLLESADRLRVEKADRAVDLCAIVNARSGRCGEDCAFCAQSARYQTGATVTPLASRETLLKACHTARQQGAARVGIVTSGEALPPRDFERLLEDIAFLKEESPVTLCASIGVLDRARAEALRDAGLCRVHHNLETAPSHYDRICTTHPISKRLGTLDAAKEAGLELCAGGLFGIGESWDQRRELVSTLAAFEPESVPLNFLIPIPGTPLAHMPTLPPEEILRIIALFRIGFPKSDIRVCGGRAHLGDQMVNMFRAGANGMMIGTYLTTSGLDVEKDHIFLQSIGLHPTSPR